MRYCPIMEQLGGRDEHTQQTPEGETIPVPTRGDVLRDLRKVAKAPQRPSDADGGSTEDEQ